MSTLAVTYVFAPGGVIRASEHNQNMADIEAWANGNVGNDNLGVLNGTVTWTVTTNVKAISATVTGTSGVASFAQNATLTSGLSAVSISSNAAQGAGAALLSVSASSASNNIPAVLITDAGTNGPSLQVVSTTKGSIPAPSMTTAQRNAMGTKLEGEQIYNSSLKRLELFDGTNWVDAAGRTGDIVDVGGALKPYHLAANGQVVAQSTYPALFALYGTIWNTGGEGSGNFRLPDLCGRSSVGAGTGQSGLTTRTVATAIGAEDSIVVSHDHGIGTHTHEVSGTTGGESQQHHHSLNTTNRSVAGNTFFMGNDGGTGSDAGHDTGDASASHTHSMLFTSGGPSANNTTSTGSSGTGANMQPSMPLNKCVII